MTGGAANPFRASMANPTSGPMNGNMGVFPSSASSPSGFGGRGFMAPSWNGTPFSAFGGAPEVGATGTAQDLKQSQPQQNGS